MRRIFSVTRFWASTGPVEMRVVWKLRTSCSQREMVVARRVSSGTSTSAA